MSVTGRTEHHGITRFRSSWETKDPTGHTFVTGGGFFGLRPLSTTGSVDRKNPLPADLLQSRL
jgi:hypothetical protein